MAGKSINARPQYMSEPSPISKEAREAAKDFVKEHDLHDYRESLEQIIQSSLDAQAKRYEEVVKAHKHLLDCVYTGKELPTDSNQPFDCQISAQTFNHNRKLLHNLNNQGKE